MDEDLPRFIDFEATGDGNKTYPIEVAWSDESGWVESYLISPVGVAGWTGWSAEAEAIHHIPQSELLSAGRTPRFVCERMVATVGDGILYCDGVPWDTERLEQLFEAAELVSPFEVRGIDKLAAIRALDDVTANELKARAVAMTGSPHRAGNDVACHVAYYKLALERLQRQSP